MLIQSQRKIVTIHPSRIERKKKTRTLHPDLAKTEQKFPHTGYYVFFEVLLRPTYAKVKFVI